jgi:hypothetical protein
MERSNLQAAPGETSAPPCAGGELPQQNRDALLAQADAQQAQGNITGAVRLYLAVAALPASPEDTARIHEQVGDLLFAHQRYQAAMVAYQQAVLHQPTAENQRKYDASIAARAQSPVEDVNPPVVPAEVEDAIVFTSLAEVAPGEAHDDPSLLTRLRLLITPRRAYGLAAATLVLVLGIWLLTNPFRRHPVSPVKTVAVDTEDAAPAATSEPANPSPSTPAGAMSPATPSAVTTPTPIVLPPLTPTPPGTVFPKRAVLQHHVPASSSASRP